MSRRKRKRYPVAASKQSNMPVMEAFGDIIDPTEYLNDEPGWGGQNVAAYLVSRDRGGNAPTFSTDQELAGIRGASRIICDASVNAKCALQNLTNYVIGTGFKYSIVDKNRIVKPGEEPTPLAKDATRIIDEFLQRTKYGTAKRRKRLLWQQRRDGEVFVTLWHVGMGKAEYRVTDPGFFITPFDTRALDDMFPTPDGSPSSWSFGVHTPDDDYEQHIGYYAQYSDSSADYEYFDQTRIVHSRINVDDAIKRGLSDFYWVYTSLSDASKLLRNGVRGAAVLSAIAAIVEHPQGTDAEQVNSFKTGSSVSSYTEPTRRGGRTQYVHKYNSGSILHVPNGQKYQPSPLASTGVASSIIEIEQAVLRIIGSNWCMPEFMISSDASNNNYASILVSGSPFVKFVEAVQAECQEDDEALLWKVLGIANEAGQFARGRDLESIKEEIEIKVESPQASIKDETKEHQNNEILSRNGLLSDRTWATKAGLDYDQEVANGAKKPEPVNPLGMMGAGFGRGNDEDEKEEKKTKVVSEAKDADDEDGRWVTINGSPVFINDSGDITKGPKELVGKSEGETRGKGWGSLSNGDKTNKSSTNEIKNSDDKQTTKRIVTKSPEFKKWFGDSKVVDDRGKPLVVYHGTDKDFQQFDPEKKGTDSEYDKLSQLGYFFTPNEKSASAYASATATGYTEHPNIMPVYLSIENPYEMTSIEWNEWANNENLDIEAIKAEMVDNGHDGIHIVGYDGESDEWCIFDNTQVKSATGNRGTFSRKSPKITESRAERLREAARLLWGDYPGSEE